MMVFQIYLSTLKTSDRRVSALDWARTLSPSGPELGLSLVNLTRYMHCLSSLG